LLGISGPCYYDRPCSSIPVAGTTLVMISFSNTFENQFQLAHSQQQTSLEIDPNDKQAWVNKGDALNRNGNFSKAIAAYNRALEIDPNCVNAWDGIGWSLNEVGNYSQAIFTLTKLLR
jgi:tetratricopeptide (TPR) repeat protein